jgi:geranylgeranyl reductase family protein
MDACAVLIVGGGPAGSSCARKLRQAGVDTVILDKSAFPRNKVCGGWVTPAVMEELGIDLADYADGRVLQEITGFRTSYLGGPEVETKYDSVVSYGIRRREFDDYLLQRTGARLLLGQPLKSLERSGSHWIVNDHIETPLVVGAGGHFCPVVRFLGANARQEVAVAAQEAEFEMTPAQCDSCTIRGEFPELFFCADMKGYGWCFRKGDFLNIGLGRIDTHSLPAHVAEFIDYLKQSGKIGFDLPSSPLGHAYLIFRESHRNVASDGALLIGDAAGLAYSQSGEGIRPAVESGLLAAEAIIEANGDYSHARLDSYRQKLTARFGESQTDLATQLGQRLPPQWMHAFARKLLTTRWFSRRIVLDRWFLHASDLALDSGLPAANR